MFKQHSKCIDGISHTQALLLMACLFDGPPHSCLCMLCSASSNICAFMSHHLQAVLLVGCLFHTPLSHVSGVTACSCPSISTCFAAACTWQHVSATLAALRLCCLTVVLVHSCLYIFLHIIFTQHDVLSCQVNCRQHCWLHV